MHQPVCPCAKSPGHPGYRVSRSLPAMGALSFLSSHILSTLPALKTSGRPDAPLFQRRLSMSSGLPRILHLQALSAMDLRVAPNLASYQRFQW